MTISFRGYSVGSAVGQHQYQNNYSIRDDFTISFVKGGRHDVKIGGEYINQPTIIDWCAQCTGAIEANGGPIPANIEQLFPVWNDALDLEPGGALADHRARAAGGVEHRLPLRGAAAPVRRLAAGRLEGVDTR